MTTPSLPPGALPPGALPPGAFKLTKDELQLISLLREKSHQEILVKVQDSVIVYIERTEKFRRKSGNLTK